MDALIYRTLLVQYRRWLDKCTLCGHVVRDSHDQKSNFCSQHEPSHLIWSPWKAFFQWTKLFGQAHLPSLTPDPHQYLFLYWKSKCFLAVYPLTTSCLNGELAFDFPKLLQGCTVLWSRAGSACTWAASQPDGPPGGGGGGGGGGPC